ncbi:MAG TPA: S9 family peptidase [Thermoanaerobaculia bacterium]|nr:S9 family peptidase [Thermoanaerobaculia bacterium]
MKKSRLAASSLSPFAVLAVVALLVATALAVPAASAADGPRPLRPDDIYALKSVADPRISPDGRWVAYTVRTLDAKEDRSDTDVYMVSLAAAPGTVIEPVRLTASEKPETHPRWSPDGRYLAFLSAREGKKTQVWLLDRQGGEAVKLTDYKADVSDLVWSPDGKRLALLVSDVDPDDPDAADTNSAAKKDDDKKDKAPKPIVITRRQFKRDGEGYLREIRNHVHVFDLAAKSSAQVTSGPYDDSEPVWSPDGRWIAFTSNRTPDPDSNQNTDVFVVAAKAGEKPRALTTSPGGDQSPVFSPDGQWIAYVAGGAPEDIWYATNQVAVVPVAGGPPRLLTPKLDRNVSDPRFSPDGSAVFFLIEEGGDSHLARVPAAGGDVVRVVEGERDIQSYDVGPQGEIAVLETQPTYPPEISVVEGSGLRCLTRVNDAFLAGIRLGKVERFRAKSADGTPIDAFLTLPPEAPKGKKLPTVLRIHGGPTEQFSTAWSTEWQMLAAHGYAVVAANPRGSSGYGRDFSRAIWADWGNKDYQDVMAAVDEAVARGVADPDRLGVGGWSYGGILTDHVIVKTGRFKAATSGASEVNYLANYGTDHYQYEWEAELGLPWKNTAGWMRISPWFDIEKVTTPTLVLGGSDDMNVPLLNSEQLFQALRRLGRETELVIYPGQNHGIARPSYVKDRYERYLAWYDKYLQPRKAATSTGGGARP